MKVTRRDFLDYCAKAAAVLGLQSALGPMEKALASTSGPPIIWLKGASCTGCTVTLANRISRSAPVDLADLLINTVDLVFHPTLMGAAGDLAVETLHAAEAGTFILAVEGGVPTQYDGKTCMVWTENGVDVTALDAVRILAPKAKHVLSIGTCAAYGGIAGAAPNPTAVQSVKTAAGRRSTTINIPGCPPHPDWIVWTIAQILAGSVPTLDGDGRPTQFYGNLVHNQCPRITQPWATSLDQTGLCMNDLGCKGRQTYADCPSRKWNNGVNWCVGADSLCQGCTSKGFPDSFAPLFSTVGADPAKHRNINPPRTTCMECHSSRPLKEL
jgi:hydrogenase small subunit